MSQPPATSATIEVTLRIPGTWQDPDEIARRLPAGFELRENHLVLSDGTQMEIYPRAPDDDFVQVFAGGCRNLPSVEERERIENYVANFCLLAKAGNLADATRIMAAAAAIVRAGGAGVFVDNSGVAHGGRDWLALTHPENDETGPIRAFVNAYRDSKKKQISSVGMHVFGCRDLIIPDSGNERRDSEILQQLATRLLHSPDDFEANPVEDVPELADSIPELADWRIRHDNHQVAPPNSPMHNPFGCWRLE